MYFWYEWLILIPALIAMICLVIALLCFASRKDEFVGWSAVSLILAFFAIMLHYSDGYLLQNSGNDYKLAAFVKQKSTDISELQFVCSRGMYTSVQYEGDLIVDKGIYSNAIRAYYKRKLLQDQKIAQRKADLVGSRLDNLLERNMSAEEE